MGTKRRGAAEWGRLVAAWGRSGQTAAEFGRSRGIKAATLSQWKWRLRRLSDAGASISRGAPAAEQPSGQRLVRVIPECVHPGPVPDEPQRVAWELSSPSGCVLRVFDGCAPAGAEVSAAVQALIVAATREAD